MLSGRPVSQLSRYVTWMQVACGVNVFADLLEKTYWRQPSVPVDECPLSPWMNALGPCG